jgi:hypothetical protein
MNRNIHFMASRSTSRSSLTDGMRCILYKSSDICKGFLGRRVIHPFGNRGGNMSSYSNVGGCPAAAQSRLSEEVNS